MDEITQRENPAIWSWCGYADIIDANNENYIQHPFPQKADCAMLTHSGDGGAPLGAGRGFVMTAEGPTLTGFNSAYRTSSTSDTVSMNYSWWAVGE